MNEKSNQLPSGAGKLADAFPSVWAAYSGLGEACSQAGPIDSKTRRLVKLSFAIGANSEGAVHSHVRQGLAEGISAKEFVHIAILAIPTLGLPTAVKAMTWINDVVENADRK